MMDKLKNIPILRFYKKNIYNAVCNIKFDMEFKIPDA